MSKKARRPASKKSRRLKSVHVDRLAEQLAERVLLPEVLVELESAAIDASATAEDLSGTEWEDLERAAAQDAPAAPDLAMDVPSDRETARQGGPAASAESG